MDIGEEEAFVFSVYCSGVWPKSAVELSPKFQPTKVLYKTPEYCFKDLLETIEEAEFNGDLYAISEIHLEHVTVLESKEDKQAYKWSYNTHQSPKIREFPTVVLDWWFGKI